MTTSVGDRRGALVPKSIRTTGGRGHVTQVRTRTREPADAARCCSGTESESPREDARGPKQDNERHEDGRRREVRDRSPSQKEGDMKEAERNHGETPLASEKRTVTPNTRGR